MFIICLSGLGYAGKSSEVSIHHLILASPMLFLPVSPTFADISEPPPWSGLHSFPPCIQEKGTSKTPGHLSGCLPTQFHHDVRNLDILLRRVFRCDFENDILLVTWDWFFGNGFEELAHPIIMLVKNRSTQDSWDSLQWHSILKLGWRIETCI